jgi:hypothetical protein
MMSETSMAIRGASDFASARELMVAGNSDTVVSAERDDVGEEYLAEAVVRLIQSNRQVQRAILDFVMSCPNVRTVV